MLNNVQARFEVKVDEMPDNIDTAAYSKESNLKNKFRQLINKSLFLCKNSMIEFANFKIPGNRLTVVCNSRMVNSTEKSNLSC